MWFPAPPAKTPTFILSPNPKTNPIKTSQIGLVNIQIGHLPYRSILQLCKALRGSELRSQKVPPIKQFSGGKLENLADA